VLWLWVEGLLIDHLHANESTLRVELNVNLLRSMMPQILRTRNFLESQEYKVHDSVLYQDNQSVILVEKNDRGSSSKRTRHINIQYFFIKDRIASGEVKLKYFPTETMLADAFTKPLQIIAFVQFKDSIMSVSSHKNNEIKTRSMLRIPDGKMCKPYKGVLTWQKKASSSEKKRN